MLCGLLRLLLSLVSLFAHSHAVMRTVCLSLLNEAQQCKHELCWLQMHYASSPLDVTRGPDVTRESTKLCVLCGGVWGGGGKGSVLAPSSSQGGKNMMALMQNGSRSPSRLTPSSITAIKKSGASEEGKSTVSPKLYLHVGGFAVTLGLSQLRMHLRKQNHTRLLYCVLWSLGCLLCTLVSLQL